MSTVVGLTGPTHLEREQWLTVRGCKKVLAVVPTLTYAQRLLDDIVPLLESDSRIEVSFAVLPHPFGEGTTHFLHRLGCPVLPWEVAVGSEFDLALAVGRERIGELRAPVVLLSHGAGHNKRRRLPRGERAELPGALDRHGGLLDADGRVVPAVLGLAHADELAVLAHGCPEALAVAHVVGDPSYDRLAVSLPNREAYRAALGVEPDQTFVVATTTWGQSGAFGRLRALLPRMLGELPRPAYRAAMLAHPNVAGAHGWWQVRGWLSVCRQGDVLLVPQPEVDFRAILCAADVVVGDHGSVTSYATLTDAPILLAAYPWEEVHEGSPAAALAVTALGLTPEKTLVEQVEYARECYRREEYAAVAARISSEPGRFNAHLRRLIYRRLGISEPAYPPVTRPVPLPRALGTLGVTA
ncbi:hypothetical protein ACTWP5_28180 [Streptomyces sp. 4N509B]|uniref:hypothetical protein n=1 Tax=Streptomyces sp. 4N509B TaxID=3457413 RepID=UPI003FD0E010